MTKGVLVLELHLDVRRVISAHILLAKTSNMFTSNFKKTWGEGEGGHKECNLITYQ